MKNMKFARTFLTLALVLVVLGSVIGGTIAWFTDEVTSTNNIIKSGTLDLDVQVMGDDGAWISLEKNPNTAVFDYDLWEPGYTQYEQVRIINKGSLAFEYILNVVPGADEVKGPNGESLADVIDVYVGETAPADRNLEGMTNLGTIADLLDPAADADMVAGILLPAEGKGATDVTIPEGDTPVEGEVAMYIALHMQEEAGNEYQNLSLGTVGFTAEAKQYTYEEDSFDHTYDENALWHSETDNEPVNGGDVPVANITNIADDELPTNVDIREVGNFGNILGNAALDVGFVFSTTETAEEAANSPYANWHADFVVSLDADTAAGSCGLAGQYSSWSEDWWGFSLPIDAEANQEFRLLQDAAGINFTYEMLCSQVVDFGCGVFNLDDANVGTKLTVQLCLFEPADPETTNPNEEQETGNFVVVSTHVYELEPVQECNRDIND